MYPSDISHFFIFSYKLLPIKRFNPNWLVSPIHINYFPGNFSVKFFHEIFEIPPASLIAHNPP